MSSTQLKMGVRPWHEDLLEFLIANPRASGPEVAFHFGVSESWLSIVKNSDAFKELWASRRGEHFSRVSATITEKVSALAEVTVDALTDRIEKEKTEGTVSIASLREVGEMALRSLGFGNKGIASVQINAPSQTNIIIDKETLAQARAIKAKLQELNPPRQIEEIELTTLTSSEGRPDFSTKGENPER